MASVNIDYSFSNGTTANALEVNANFQSLKAFVDSQLVQADGSVKAGTAALQDSAVTTDKIDDGAVTEAKVSSSIANGIIKTFSSTAARDAAIPSPSAGMVVYVNSNDSSEGLYTHNGSSWTKGAGWNSPWGFVASTQSTSDSASATTSPVNVFSSLSFTALANRLYVVSATCYPSITDPNVDTSIYANLIGTVNQNMMFLAPVYTTQIHRVTTSYLYAPTVNTSASINVEVGRFNGTGSVKNIASGSNPSQLFVYDIGPSGAPA